MSWRFWDWPPSIPERLIADSNIDRFEQTGQLDAEYLSRLSADIDPALHRLPEPDPGLRDGARLPTVTPGLCSTSRGRAPIVPSTVRCRTFAPPSAGTNTADSRRTDA